MSSSDFTEMLKAQAQGKAEGGAEKKAADTFTSTTPKREPLHRTTINLPISMYESLRREAFENNTSMTDLLIDAWKESRKIK